MTNSTQDWRRTFWLSLLIASSAVFTFKFACAVPYAAFAAATALTLSKRDAIIMTIGLWLVNQFIGFTFLHYPQDANTFAWGFGLGVVAPASLFAARITAHYFDGAHSLVVACLAFIAAFMAYEASCYGFSLILGGEADFTLAIQTSILTLNAVTLPALLLINRAASAMGFAPALTQQHA